MVYKVVYNWPLLTLTMLLLSLGGAAQSGHRRCMRDAANSKFGLTAIYLWLSISFSYIELLDFQGQLECNSNILFHNQRFMHCRKKLQKKESLEWALTLSGGYRPICLSILLHCSWESGVQLAFCLLDITGITWEERTLIEQLIHQIGQAPCGWCHPLQR